MYPPTRIIIINACTKLAPHQSIIQVSILKILNLNFISVLYFDSNVRSVLTDGFIKISQLQIDIGYGIGY